MRKKRENVVVMQFVRGVEALGSEYAPLYKIAMQDIDRGAVIGKREARSTLRGSRHKNASSD